MIDLSPEIKKDLASDINNFDILVHIITPGKTYYLATKEQGIYSSVADSGDQSDIDLHHHEDLIMKVGNIKESIDLQDRKIKLSNTSITINNAKVNFDSETIGGRRFTDVLRGDLHGGLVNIYIKTASCFAITQCLRIAVLKISSVKHSRKVDT